MRQQQLTCAAVSREHECRILDHIDEGRIAADVAELVGIPSVDGTAAELDAQAWCADRLRGVGMTVDEWPIDVAALAAGDGFCGMEVERDRATGCVGLTGVGTPALIFNGHVDVVPPGDVELWPDGDPFTARLIDGEWWGRGTCDMKAGVAAMIGAVEAIGASGARLERPLAIHTVAGEEDGGLGTYATLRRGHRGEACLIAEPTTDDIVAANAGALTFRIVVRGLATHGSTRTAGVSAIEKFERVHTGIRQLERRRNGALPELFQHLDLGWPISVGLISAGDWASTVPDRCVAQGRYGVMPGESIDEAKAAFADAVAAVARDDDWLRDHPVELTWPGGMFAPGQIADGHPLVELTRRAAEDAGGRPPRSIGGPYGSDLRQYVGAGIPTLQYGPGDVRLAHAVGERVPVESVMRCARTYALLAARVCGVAD